MKLNEKFTDLVQFFGCYFHQDMFDDYASDEMAIKGYVDDDGPDAARHVARELDKLLELGLPEAELDTAMYKELHCYYSPKPDGISMTEWLRWVRSTLLKYAQSAPEKSS